MILNNGIYQQDPQVVKEQHGGINITVYIHSWYFFINSNKVYRCIKPVNDSNFIVTKDNVLNQCDICDYVINKDVLIVTLNRGKRFETIIKFKVVSDFEFIGEAGKFVFQSIG
jgi:hypothetical protein